jgi:hypothetical protein
MNKNFQGAATTRMMRAEPIHRSVRHRLEESRYYMR